MKDTQDKLEFVQSASFDPNHIKTIVAIILCSFAVGSIPIIYGVGTPEVQNVVPSEATLWKTVSEK